MESKKTSIDGRYVLVEVSATKTVDLKMRGIGLTNDSVWITLGASTIRDMAYVSNTLLTNGLSAMKCSVVLDHKQAVVQFIDLDMNDQTILITMDEPLKDTGIDITAVGLQNMKKPPV